MLGDLITSGLVLAFGYAYPALECFKTVVDHRVEIEELRFWCQYWIIVAVITVFERVGDMFVSWLPMYGEAKLALFIYLWYPKTKGCGYVFENILQPFVARNETDLERWLQEFKVRAMDVAIYYWQNCTELGQTKFFEVLQYSINPSRNVVLPNSEMATNRPPSGNTRVVPTAPSPPPTLSSLFRRHRDADNIRRTPPPSPSTRRIIAQSPVPKTELVQVHLENQSEFVFEGFEGATMLDEVHGLNPIITSEQNGVDQKTRFRFGRSKATSPRK